MNNELMNFTNEFKMNHVELCELINKLRNEEGNRKEMRQRDFIVKIRKEVDTMKTLELEGVRNFSQSYFEDSQGKKHETFLMNRDGVLQMSASESVYVRAKIIEYINALENKLKEQNEKKDLVYLIYQGGQNAVVASQKLTQIEVEEATRPLLDTIEENKPLVDFANTIAQTSNSIDINTFAKLIKDEGVKMGRNKLFEWLRNNGYLMKNNQPYQRYIDNGYFETTEYTISTPFGDILKVKTLITGKGQIKILEKIKESVGR